MNIKPNRILPSRVFALMWGRSLRRENIDTGANLWDARPRSKLWFLVGTEAVRERAVLTHLQKKMKWGVFMTTGRKSWGLHFWYHWHMQEFQDENAYTPNSEQGIYLRFPGHRWDLELGMIKTGGRAPGAHWD